MTSDPFSHANQQLFRNLHRRWHKQQTRLQILRSQVGYSQRPPASQPPACVGCGNYHGIAYGSKRDSRTRLICAIHPDGWRVDSACPDWRVEELIAAPYGGCDI